jgi:hypothetical protein
LIAVAGGPRAGAGEPAATVDLAVPYQTVLATELIRFTVRLRNDSGTGLPVIADPFRAGGKQVFIRVEREERDFEEAFRSDSRPGFGRPLVRTIERDGDWDIVLKEATASLQPSQTVEWDGSRFDDMLFYITRGKPKSIQAQVLIGSGLWVSSKPVPIKVIPRDVSRCPVVFQGVYLVGPQKARRPMTVHRVQLGTQQYLFDGAGGRICEIPKGGTPKFAWSPATALLIVTFSDTTAAPVRYDVRHMTPVTERASAEPESPVK